jgi:transcriptional regulator with XRE-family HTH domain
MSTDHRLITTTLASSAFSAELRRLRAEHRLSQNRLAELASVDHSHISRLESGTDRGDRR